MNENVKFYQKANPSVMNIFKSLFGQNEEDRLLNDFLEASQEMNLPKAHNYLEQMSDECFLKAVVKIDKLSKSEPGYVALNALLYAVFLKRPQLRNPFIKNK